MGWTKKYRMRVTGKLFPSFLPFPIARRVHLSFKALLVFALYCVAGRLSSHLIPPAESINPFWMPSAFAVCACLVWGRRMGVGVCLGATALALAGGIPFSTAILLGVVAAAEAITIVYLIRHGNKKTVHFSRLEYIWRFVWITITGAMLAALWRIALSPLSGQPSSMGVIGWATTWLGDTAGILVVTPPLLASPIFSPKVSATKWSPPRYVETGLVTLASMATTVAIFGNGPIHPMLMVLPLIFIVWSALRLNLAVATGLNGLICIIAVWHTAHEMGPLWTGALDLSLLQVAAYNTLMGIATLSLAALVKQQRANIKRFLQERDYLKRKLQEKTAALALDIDERKRLHHALTACERQLVEAEALAQLGSWQWDIESGAVTWSDELYRIAGVHKEQFHVTPNACTAMIHQEDLENLLLTFQNSRSKGKPFHIEHRIVNPSGKIRYVVSRGFVSTDGNGSVVRLFGTTQDITASKRAEFALREVEQRYRLVIELCPDAILVNQDGVVTFANPAAMTLLGAKSIVQIVGKPLSCFAPDHFHEAVKQQLNVNLDVNADITQHGPPVTQTEEKFIRTDGSFIDVDIHSSSFIYKDAQASLLIVRDITERKKTAEQMAYLAHYDSLTGLPNRALFHQRLAHALHIAERPERSLEILFLDLDRFKHINDTLGHGIGDMVLAETARRLQSILRESDTVARLGGDEFVVLVENIDEPYRGSTIAGKILAAMKPAFMINNLSLPLTTSIGISSFPSDGIDAETLLKKADMAMYRAKESGRNTYRYYSDKLNQDADQQLTLQYALQHAIGLNQLALHYQPKINTLSGRITGMEALLRWEHPTLGPIPPQKIIALAEETDLTRSIGKWTMLTACKQNRYWHDMGRLQLTVSVNLSHGQLIDEDLIPDIAEILDETGIEARFLELEISEESFTSNVESTVLQLTRLRELGVGLSIDGFGIGHASLSNLKNFPIKVVKLDRSFIQGLPDDHADAAIVKAIIGLAHSLDCKVVAQGAETVQQVDFLQKHYCDNIQGHYFSAPVCADHVCKMLETEQLSM